jgi:hypothetical protein
MPRLRDRRVGAPFRRGAGGGAGPLKSAIAAIPSRLLIDGAEQIAPVIRELQKRGCSMRGIAVELEKRKVETPRGGAWHPQLVKRIVQRLEQQCTR